MIKKGGDFKENSREPFAKKYAEENLRWCTRKVVFYKKCYYILAFITIVCPIVLGIVLLRELEEPLLKIFSGIILGISDLSAFILVLFDFKKKQRFYSDEADRISIVLEESDVPCDIEKDVESEKEP